jgi:hypothetical protein
MVSKPHLITLITEYLEVFDLWFHYVVRRKELKLFLFHKIF